MDTQGSFRTELAAAPWEFSFTFRSARSVSYYCETHLYYGRMTGGLNILPASNSPPSILLSLSRPEPIYANETVGITATATDDLSVKLVEYFEGTTLLATTETSPFSLPPRPFSPGEHIISARVSDHEGASTLSSPLSVNIMANSRPAVTITSPLNQKIYDGSKPLTFAVTASDPDGPVSRVDFFLRDPSGTLHPFRSVATTPFTLNFPTFNGGQHTLYATSVDSSGVESPLSAPITFSVLKPPRLILVREGNTFGLAVPAPIYGQVQIQRRDPSKSGPWITISTASPGGGGIGLGGLPVSAAPAIFRVKIESPDLQSF